MSALLWGKQTGVGCAHHLERIDYIMDRFRMLHRAAGLPESEYAAELLRKLVTPVGRPHVDWRSEISDDNTPVEFSVAIAGGRTEVRALFEAQASEPTLEAHREAGLLVLETLERDFGADVAGLRVVRDLFLPEQMEGAFAVWWSVVFSHDQSPAFKVYFNPQARGQGHAYALMEEALDRLGLTKAWGSLCSTSVRRGPHLDEVKYLSLDLISASNARVKVYTRHHDASPEDLEIASSDADDYIPGEAYEFACAMAPGVTRFSARAPFTCSAFIRERDGQPVAKTLYIPVCAYARDDEVARNRMMEYLTEHSLDALTYNKIIHGFANRPLQAGVGMQSWTALRRYNNKTRLTVYLSTEAMHVHPPGSTPAGTAGYTAYQSVTDVFELLSIYNLSKHPFFQRLKRCVTSPEVMAMLMVKVGGASWNQLNAWLADIIPQTRDANIREVLSGHLDRQLRNDEASDYARCPEVPGEQMIGHCLANDVLQRISALLAGKVCVGQLRRAFASVAPENLQLVNPALATWCAYRDDEIAQDENDALLFASLAASQPAALDSVYRGVSGIHHAFWTCLDEAYLNCLG